MMKVILFCGGFGTRLREHSETVPKPMVNIGARPIMWHLMKYYDFYGHNDYILCLGYGSNIIKQFFLTYNECMYNDFTMTSGGKALYIHGRDIQDWTITFAETGLHTNIGQRLKAVKKYIGQDEYFLANYSDGLSNFPLSEYVQRFKESDAVASFVSTRPSQSFHAIHTNQEGIVSTIEPVSISDFWINSGFFIMRNKIFDYLQNGEDLVDGVFPKLIKERRLIAYKYEGFWASMDTYKDKKAFDQRCEQNNTPWVIWN
jgi:glucose-1-phosphate cytidylyltransferase